MTAHVGQSMPLRRRAARPLLIVGAAMMALPLCWRAGAGFAGAATAPPLGWQSATARHAEPAAVAERPAAGQELTDNPRKQGLALMLDDGTRKSHSMAENTQFVTGFFKGLGDKASFSQLVASLYFVYEAMETAFETTADQQVRTLDYPALRRLAAIEEDLAYFYGPDWRSQIQPTAGARLYAERVAKVAAESPELLIAHQYTRYLGDLFGGQMMGGMAEKSLGLESGSGTSFYRFRDIPDPMAFITEWYTKLNALELSTAEKEAIVDEANLVFRLNIEIFEELEGSPFAAVWQLFSSSVRSSLGLA
ncbi:unnamed protein product [Polarella glacialis]|uniref:Uncharacterized protein n=1 Tax=Polarella glacialis TaxID=89957 RepID=A0A813D3Y6_POLGL|nr:unnamed protein product [Polarella glacialis]|mmetsp:Transcript_35042/g.63146  ORF Transcript_35042/g.63146 Transcript_35042/m.63146 type:complete len:307 (-) Transcript_35042:155-1075(-)